MATVSSFRLGINVLSCIKSDGSHNASNNTKNKKKVCKVCRDAIRKFETNSDKKKTDSNLSIPSNSIASTKLTTWIIHTSSVKIYRNENACSRKSNIDKNKIENTARQIGIFIPPSIVSLIDDKHGYCKSRSKRNEYCNSIQSEESCKCCIQEVTCNRNDAYAISLASLLAKIHPSLSCLDIECIVLVTKPVVPIQKSQSTACIDLLVINIPPCISYIEFVRLFDDVNGEGMVTVPNAVIKVIPISEISLEYFDSSASMGEVLNANYEIKLKIPSCPVCLHRIDPLKLGLLKTKDNKLCSDYCETTIASSKGCENQMFLTPWPSPAHCDACAIILEYYNFISSMSSMEYATFLSLSSENDVHPTANTSEENNNSSVMQEYPSFDENQIINQNFTPSQRPICCFQCKMQETLWVCLTCGIVGCGRYSNKHADKHYRESGHQFSLELATHRIWDYAADGFAQRVDLLTCPFHRTAFFHDLKNGLSNSIVSNTSTNHSLNAMRSPSNSSTTFNKDSFKSQVYTFNVKAEEEIDCNNMILSNDSNYDTCCSTTNHQLTNSHNTSTTTSINNHEEPNVKKTIMVGEEYEVLLQSALEDQAQHYESEISRLHTQITADKLDSEQISQEEKIEIQALQDDISALRLDINHYSQLLLDFQGQEAGYRATCQQLLQNQKESSDELAMLQNKLELMKQERAMQIEDLNQQISDIGTNLQMRDRILANHQELSQAQIVGASPSKDDCNGKSKGSRGSGKKKGRFHRFGRR